MILNQRAEATAALGSRGAGEGPSLWSSHCHPRSNAAQGWTLKAPSLEEG